MKHRLNHESREQAEEEMQAAGTESTRETALSFDLPEEMIRHDAARTPVPPEMRERVMQSIAREAPPKSPTPWWKRWMRS